VKIEQVQKLMQGGGVFAIGEFRKSKLENVKYRDKQTGKMAEFNSHVHTIETGEDTIFVQDRIEDGTDPHTLKPPFPKGVKVIVGITTLERVQGFLRATGTMSAID